MMINHRTLRRNFSPPKKFREKTIFYAVVMEALLPNDEEKKSNSNIREREFHLQAREVARWLKLKTT
jgi:hypothetical protein